MLHSTPLTILIVVSIIIIFIGFIIYSINTTKIIKSQEKEIAQLRTTIKRKEQYEMRYINGKGKIPDFGKF